MDCPFVGELPNFKPDHPAVTWLRYNEHTMWEKGARPIRGKICEQSYTVKPGTDPMSALEVNENYKDQLTQEGVEITNDDDTCKIWGRIVKDGKTNWIEVRCGSNDVVVTVLEETPMPQVLQPTSGQDYRLIGHIEGYQVDKATKVNFDEQDFWTHKGTVNVRGVKYVIAYTLSKNAPPASGLEVADNYRDALTVMGAEIIYGDNDETDNRVTARLEDGGKTVWIQGVRRQQQLCRDRGRGEAVRLVDQAARRRRDEDRAGIDRAHGAVRQFRLQQGEPEARTPRRSSPRSCNC